MQFNLNIKNINYIKILYRDKNDKICCTKAAIKIMGEREIVACAKFDEDLYINTPQDIALSIVCENGLYRTTTQLKYIENSEPYVYFTLKTPSGLEYQQNREYFRVRMENRAILSFKQDEDLKVIPCKVYDISASGVRLELSESIDYEPEEANIEILFDPKPVSVKAKYVRYDEEDNIPKISFVYSDIPQNVMDIISQKCIQRQLEYKRSTLG